MLHRKNFIVLTSVKSMQLKVADPAGQPCVRVDKSTVFGIDRRK
jgi:hypothetical protein